MIEITEHPLDPLLPLAAVASNEAGANLLFLGTTRQWTGETETRELDYECYREMAERKLADLAAEARDRWNLTGVAIVHRIGTVRPGETSLAVAVSSPHRPESFAAGQWLIEAIKQVVPVWKREVDNSGQGTWVHPARSGATGSDESSR